MRKTTKTPIGAGSKLCRTSFNVPMAQIEKFAIVADACGQSRSQMICDLIALANEYCFATNDTEIRKKWHAMHSLMDKKNRGAK